MTFRVLCASTKQEDHVNRLSFLPVNASDKLHVASIKRVTTNSRLVRIQKNIFKNGLILDFVHSRTRIFADQADFRGFEFFANIIKDKLLIIDNNCINNILLFSQQSRKFSMDYPG